jgi:deazaflavin-dependent oxidoreductase (nitroreductase family)
MQLPQRLARFNRHVTNPIQRMWAGWAPSFGILEHVGRKSGKAYRTPLTVFNADVDGKPGVAILLTYGPDRDWLKNITAAEGGRIRRNGKTFGITDPQVVTKAEAASHVVRGRRMFARLPFEQAVLFTLTPCDRSGSRADAHHRVGRTAVERKRIRLKRGNLLIPSQGFGAEHRSGSGRARRRTAQSPRPRTTG